MNAGGVLGVAGSVPIDTLPAQYREPMRRYLGEGVMPECELRELLEGALGAAIHRAERQAHARISDVMRVARWIEEHLPACAQGNRDQVNLWVIYLRRARGRAMLAALEIGA